MVKKLGRLTLLYDFSGLHEKHAVTHGQGFFLAVSNVDEGNAEIALDGDQLFLHVEAQLLVERAEWLIEQQD